MKFPFRRGGLQALSGHRVSNTDGSAYTAVLARLILMNNRPRPRRVKGGYEGRGDEGIHPQWTDFGCSLGGNQANETVRLVKLAAGIHEFPLVGHRFNVQRSHPRWIWRGWE